MDVDSDYYTKLMNFIMRNQPNSAHKAEDDMGFKKLAISSMWRCGDNGWIAFENYCEKGWTLSDDGKSDRCNAPAPSVPKPV